MQISSQMEPNICVELYILNRNLKVIVEFHSASVQIFNVSSGMKGEESFWRVTAN